VKATFEFPPDALRVLEDRVVARLEQRFRQDEPYVTAEKAAEYLSCSVHAIYRGVKAGRLPHHRDGKRLIFRLSELDEAVKVADSRNGK
jgi:excisionase family DNA binding protein